MGQILVNFYTKHKVDSATGLPRSSTPEIPQHREYG